MSSFHTNAGTLPVKQLQNFELRNFNSKESTAQFGPGVCSSLFKIFRKFSCIHVIALLAKEPGSIVLSIYVIGSESPARLAALRKTRCN